MRLLLSYTSPFARKVRIVALEKQLADRIELIEVNVVADPNSVIASNPLGQIPALVLEDGGPLYDSPVICEYLDSLAPAPQLIPTTGPERWAVLRTQALADGVMDDAVRIRQETVRRAEHERSPHWLAHWRSAIDRGVVALEAQAPALVNSFDLGAITAACALAYLDFRLPDIPWRNSATTLSDWLAQLAQRPSFAQTAPPAG